MQMLIDLIKDRFSFALKKAFSDKQLLPALLEPEISKSGNPQFGHYQCNNSLKIAKALSLPPRQVAEALLSCLDSSSAEGSKIFSSVEIAGPGFINITFDAQFLSLLINDVLHDDRLGIPLPIKREKIIVEFSSPNIAKELHVGHLRSTIIGDCLARLFEFLGWDVLRLNHIGDWGTQFGMLITYLKDLHPLVLEGKEKADLPTLMQWYRESKKRFDEDSEFKKRSQLQVVDLQGGDKLSLCAWGIICEISRKAFNEIYDLLDVKLMERGESFYNPMLPGVVADLEKKGLITVDNGAKCVFLEGFTNRDGTPLPMIIQKSDGGYNYETTDMAALRQRIEAEKVQRIIYVTDAGQALHFQQVLKTAEKAGYLDPSQVQVDHVTFGVVLGSDGKKFKTRSGETEKLIDLLFEAVKKAKEIVEQRLPDAEQEEKQHIARVLGIGAVKYADLSCHRVKDYMFSYDRMLRFEGNTAAFLLYAYVRIEGIKRKGNKDSTLLRKKGTMHLCHPSEIALALHILQFGETLLAMARDLLPNRLTDYLYELAEKFHAFYRDCRVEGAEEEESRLLLCDVTGLTLEKGLHILGLHTLQRM